MDNNKSISSRRQNIFLQNLLALGFDSALKTKEHKIVFDEKIFSLPNRRAFEVVSYFLFSKLNEVCGGKYGIIWPLVDAKDQRQFQKTAFNYLTQIAQESEIRFPLVLNSVVSSFGGEAFSELLFAFSTHVVQQVNKTFGPMLRRPKLHPKFARQAIEMLKFKSVDNVEKFQALSDTIKDHLEIYFHIAKKLTDYVDRLKLSNSESQCLLGETIRTAIKIIAQKSNTLENSLEGLTLKNKEYQDKVESLWRKLENFLSTEENLWNTISSELEDNTKLILRGSACSFSPSNKLRNSYEKRYETKISEEESDLCIPRFLKLFSLVLEFYIDSIKKGKFSETYDLQYFKDTSEIDNSLRMLQSFCTILEEGNTINKKHVDNLMKEIKLEDLNKEESDFTEDLPPSPKECWKPSVDFLNTNKDVFFHSGLQDLKLDEDIEKVLPSDSSFKENADDCGEFSPLCVGYLNSITSLNNELNDKSQTHNVTKENFNQTPSQQSATKDSAFDFPEFNIPLSWMHEESLNSQTLSEGASFSFLD